MHNLGINESMEGIVPESVISLISNGSLELIVEETKHLSDTILSKGFISSCEKILINRDNNLYEEELYGAYNSKSSYIDSINTETLSNLGYDVLSIIIETIKSRVQAKKINIYESKLFCKCVTARGLCSFEVAA